ncbi:FtsX-like permease family protein [Paenibacillus arenosi]|uniref:ABC transporter permease n=1 Tax=Paenibacillus arenosi TaxID=2774142 RepID=A0ABR9AUM7_9BACL|nr:ABC transporter permease [Paenibacillus arenosi]MBD8496910.1 ABC transporter permease [Paenibacillus arenosi]
MLVKLSMSGLKSKLKDYLVLLVGLVISVSIFYMFQTLALNKAFIESNSIISSIQFVFHAGSVLLAIITFFYILYANSFLMTLRQKEFGMYMMLGAKKHKIMMLMFLETMILGIVSLVIGNAIGIGLAQGVGQLLMKQLEFTAGGYEAFYMPSLQITCLFFLVLFILSAIMNTLKLSRISVLQLVHAESHTDRPAVKGIMTVVTAVLSIILLAIGYWAMFNMETLAQLGIIISLITTTSGTYLLFMTFLPLMIGRLKKNKKRNEKGLNSFTYAQLSFRVNSLTKVLATVAMLIALGAGAITAGMGFQNNVMVTVNGFTPYDMVIHQPTEQEKAVIDTITFTSKQQYRYKVDKKYVYYVKTDLEQHPPFAPYGVGRDSFGQYKPITEAISTGVVESDNWNDALRLIQPHYLYREQQVQIVDEQKYNQLQAEQSSVIVGVSDDFLAHKEKWAQLDKMQAAKYNLSEMVLSSKYASYHMMHGFSSGTVFMGFFLGIAFLAMMASSLMFKILSGATKDISRYQMLHKIGVRRERLVRSIYKEQFLVFLFPAIIGIAHVVLGMKMFSFILHNPYDRIWVPLTIFVVIYAAYYFITVQMYKRIVLSSK